MGNGLDLDCHGDGAAGRLTQHFIELPEGRVAYERRGEGPPLVLLHGGMADNRDWHLQRDGLAKDFTVVAWDAPGCGGSFTPPTGHMVTLEAPERVNDEVRSFLRA